MIENNRYGWNHLKTKTVTVSVKPKRKERGIVFRIGNMIDVGNGSQTVMLQPLSITPPPSMQSPHDNRDVPVPFKMGHLNFLYTSKVRPKEQNLYHLLSALYNDSKVERIVPDVLSPGDLLVFAKKAAKNNNSVANVENDPFSIQMIDALRPMKIAGLDVKKQGRY